MRHATALLYHVCAVASRNIRFASRVTSGKLILWTRYVLGSMLFPHHRKDINSNQTVKLTIQKNFSNSYVVNNNNNNNNNSEHSRNQKSKT
jgi:hypothetical protein